MRVQNAREIVSVLMSMLRSVLFLMVMLLQDKSLEDPRVEHASLQNTDIVVSVS